MLKFCSNCDGRLLAIDDPATRSKLASWAVKASGLKYTSYRAISSLSKGERPGPENSIGKLVSGTMLQDIATYAMDLQGAAGELTGADEQAASGQFQQMLLSSPSMRIAGGTDEILRNIIAERVRFAGVSGSTRTSVQQDPDQGTVSARVPEAVQRATAMRSIVRYVAPQTGNLSSIGPGSAEHRLRCALGARKEPS